MPRSAVLARRRAVPALLLCLIALLGTGCTIGTVRPGGSSSSSSAIPGAASTGPGGEVTVPLQVLQQGGATLVIVPVQIGGEGPYPFILDTGASTSAISSVLADQLGLEPTGQTAQVSGVTATQQVQLVAVPQWAVGGTALDPGPVGALDFPTSQQSDSGETTQLAGLLGSDQLSRFGSVTLDYAGQELRFTP